VATTLAGAARAEDGVSGIRLKVLAGAGVLALNFYAYHYLATQEVIPPRQSFQSFPDQLGDWFCPRREELGPEIRRNLGVTDYLICDYVRKDPSHHVAVYVGYHETQVRREGGGSSENSIHPPKHCLPGSGWSIADHTLVRLELPGLPRGGALVNRLLIAKGSDRMLVYYWYYGQGRVIAEDWRKIVWLVWDRATAGRTDGSLVRFSVPVVRGDVEQSERDLRELAREIVDRLDSYVPT
jgi:EpsI family protein